MFSLPSKSTPPIFIDDTNFVAVAALPSIEPEMVLLNVLVPAIVWSVVVITAPAAATLFASVTSALNSRLDNFVRSTLVIIAPEPALVISLRSTAAIDISAVPSKLFPAILRAVTSLVAVAELPTTSPVKFPINPELAVIEVPVIDTGVVPPIMASLIDPPVIDILSLF